MIQLPTMYDYNAALSSQLMTMQLIAQSITGSVFSNPANTSFTPCGFGYGWGGFPFFGNFNTGLFAMNTSSTTNTGDSSTPSSSSTPASTSESDSSKNGATSQIKDMSYWKGLGYDAAKGKRLSSEAQKGKARGFLGKCATYVKRAIEKAGYGKYKLGNGCDMENVYADNKNFKKISGKGINPKNVPAGVIAVFEAGKSGYHKVYGHTEISNGDGTFTSDGTTRNPREASWYLVPVSTNMA